MNKHFPKKAQDIKSAVAIAELRRAHYIITMLAAALAVIVGFASVFDVRLNAVMGMIAVVLLLLVAAVSLGTAFVLRKR